MKQSYVNRTNVFKLYYRSIDQQLESFQKKYHLELLFFLQFLLLPPCSVTCLLNSPDDVHYQLSKSWLTNCILFWRILTVVFYDYFFISFTDSSFSDVYVTVKVPSSSHNLKSLKRFYYYNCK